MNELIDKVIESIKTKVSDLNYNNWIKPANFKLNAPGRITIEVPNKFIRDWITENHLSLIKYELYRLTGSEHEILFTILPEESPSQAPSIPPSAEPQEKRVPDSPQVDTINPKYNFDAFIVGSGNQLAHAAALAVADAPARVYNPLFIYGGVGLGKTHLLCAIGRFILRQNPSARILYITGEHFTNEVVECIRSGKMFEFRKKYRDSCDVFLVDDVQFIAGKERTQEEFFHTFNFLYESRRQIVLTSDKPPKDILLLEERLRSRFEWGLIADIQSPDTETRAAILKKKAEQEGWFLPDEVTMFLATNIRSNVRELEGSLIRIGAFASLSQMPITLEMAKEVLKNLLTDPSRRLTIETIQKLVSDHYQIRITELKSDRRLKNLILPRQIAMYLCRKHIKSSFPELGIKFGGKDHSTVVHAVQKIEKRLSEDPSFRVEVDSVERILLT